MIYYFNLIDPMDKLDALLIVFNQDRYNDWEDGNIAIKHHNPDNPDRYSTSDIFSQVWRASVDSWFEMKHRIWMRIDDAV